MSMRFAMAAGAPRCGRLVIGILAGALALTALVPATARAQDEEGREGKFELFVLGQYTIGDETDISGVDLEYDDTFAGGVGVGFNIAENINFNGTVLIGEANFSLDAFGVNVEDDSTVISPEFNVDWNILDQAFTPFVTVGAGAMIFTGGAVDETDFTYGIGAGVRWDIASDLFLKVWYRAKWFELEDADDEFLLHTINIGFGLMR